MTRFPIMHCLAALISLSATIIQADEWQLNLQKQQETSPASGRYHTIQQPAKWKPEQTAIIVCDVWDAHHCFNAVKRMEQFLPNLNQVLKTSRAQGVTIIHAPSDCMSAYAENPARKRAMTTPKAAKLPDEIGKWCSRIPAEEAAAYPIDQSDGGEDDDPAEHAEWAAKLKAQGRNPKMPWKAQHPAITIDEKNDYISDKGDEVWSILEFKGIKNVILAGVHTNMCVLGRPFGLRQMVKNGKNAVLMRDLTDTMYNPARRPYVSHFTGTERIIDHVERFVCPTVTSNQIIGGKPFRFKDDTRPRVAVMMAEDEYETNRTLTHFALTNLGHDFAVRFIYGNENDKFDMPGLDALDEADLLILSVRRRPLKKDQLERIQKFVRFGKPMVGIRTASHAFHLRTGTMPEGVAGWPELDAEIWGGHYTNHHANNLKSQVVGIEATKKHPILTGVTLPFVQGGSFYQVKPLDPKAVALLSGEAEGVEPEPVAYTFVRKDGGRSFYTSLGQKSDFDNKSFVRMMVNSLFWAIGRDVPKQFEIPRSPIMKPGDWNATTWNDPDQPWKCLADQGLVNQPIWARCLISIASVDTTIEIQSSQNHLQVYCNGQIAERISDGRWKLPQTALEPGELNLIALRWAKVSDPKGHLPVLTQDGHKIPIGPVWEICASSQTELARLPLPAKFAAATDAISRKGH